MIKHLLIISFLLVVGLNRFGCDCITFGSLSKEDSASLHSSNHVVLVEVIETGQAFKFIIIENLKGTISKDTLTGSAIDENGFSWNCTFYPTKKGKYLFYLNAANKNGDYNLSQCGPNRNMEMTDLSYSVPNHLSKKELVYFTEQFINKIKQK